MEGMQEDSEEINHIDGALSSDDVDREYIICACGETFHNEDSLKIHLDMYQNNCGNNAANVCEFCCKVFDNLRSLGIHRKRVHLTPKPGDPGYVAPNYLICSECGKGCLNKFLLAAHLRSHTGERPYECDICHKRFTVQLLLTIHRRIHTGERPFLCSLCPKAFPSRSAIDRHMRVHTGVKPYECAICNKRFTQSNSCKLHYRTVHLKEPCPYKRNPRPSRRKRVDKEFEKNDETIQVTFAENAAEQHLDLNKFEIIQGDNAEIMAYPTELEIEYDFEDIADVEHDMTATSPDKSMADDEETVHSPVETMESDLPEIDSDDTVDKRLSPVRLETEVEERNWDLNEKKSRILQKVVVSNILQDDRKEFKNVVFLEKKQTADVRNVGLGKTSRPAVVQRTRLVRKLVKSGDLLKKYEF